MDKFVEQNFGRGVTFIKALNLGPLGPISLKLDRYIGE